MVLTFFFNRSFGTAILGHQKSPRVHKPWISGSPCPCSRAVIVFPILLMRFLLIRSAPLVVTPSSSRWEWSLYYMITKLPWSAVGEPMCCVGTHSQGLQVCGNFASFPVVICWIHLRHSGELYLICFTNLNHLSSSFGPISFPVVKNYWIEYNSMSHKLPLINASMLEVSLVEVIQNLTNKFYYR